jgi:aquaporin Z
MKKYIAEFIGTAVLVLIGCGAAVIAGDQIGFLGISFAFGLAVVAMVYTIGGISGCHINPAITLGMWMRGKISTSDGVSYVVAQMLGALAGAALLGLIMGSTAAL